MATKRWIPFFLLGLGLVSTELGCAQPLPDVSSDDSTSSATVSNDTINATATESESPTGTGTGTIGLQTTGVDDTGTTGGSTGRPGTTTDEPTIGSTTGDPMGACTEIITFEMQPSEATYDGGWMLGMSMIGEGEIAQYNMFGGGSFTYEPDIPCNDTWYIWTRSLDDGPNDSYFATLDGEPMPEAIFEGDCTSGGAGYIWVALNWRDQTSMACEYVENPWAPDWTAGVHQIEFSFREALSMGRILITNDQSLVPM